MNQYQWNYYYYNSVAQDGIVPQFTVIVNQTICKTHTLLSFNSNYYYDYYYDYDDYDYDDYYDYDYDYDY